LFVPEYVKYNTLNDTIFDSLWVKLFSDSLLKPKYINRDKIILDFKQENQSIEAKFVVKWMKNSINFLVHF